jgi:6-methylsalicylic acid synthase
MLRPGEEQCANPKTLVYFSNMAPFLGVSDFESPKEVLTPTTERSISPGPSQHVEDEDIAVIGMGCRLPGGINSPEDLWEALMDKKVASGDIPEMRWEPYYRRDSRNTKVRALFSMASPN